MKMTGETYKTINVNGKKVNCIDEVTGFSLNIEGQLYYVDYDENELGIEQIIDGEKEWFGTILMSELPEGDNIEERAAKWILEGNEPDFITAAQEVVDNLGQSDLRSYVEGFCKFLIENPNTETAKSFSGWWEEDYTFIHNVNKYGQDIQGFVKDFIADEDIKLYKTYIDEFWAEQF
jgi:hypothetical protein